MNREALMERFFNALISGQRAESRAIVDELVEADCAADKILANLVWPVLDQIQNLYRNDQLSVICHHYATRQMAPLVAQLQLRLNQADRRGELCLVTCGDADIEEIAAQMTADLLEADGYDVIFAGGGIANDELVNQINNLSVDRLVIFGATAPTVPQARQLIDHLQDIGASEKTQIIVGGGVFNRAEGLAEEIGADLWANTPDQVVEVMDEFADRRMTADQRTVGRKRRAAKSEAA